jgi:hypothetical protein
MKVYDYVYMSYKKHFHSRLNIILFLSLVSEPGSVVVIRTGYGLDGLGIESRCGRDFPHLSRPALGPTQPPVQ